LGAEFLDKGPHAVRLLGDGIARYAVIMLMAGLRALWFWCLCSFGVIAATGADTPTEHIKNDNLGASTLDRAVDTELSSYFQSKCHVGVSLAVVYSSGTHYYDYVATTRPGAKLPDRRSIYEIASVTKVFTATLAAKAIADKRMALDSDFRSYLPDTYSNLAWHGQPITLRWLVTHRSGMPRDIPNTDAIFAESDFHTRPYELITIARGYDRSRTLAALRDVNLQSRPGEKESYSNAGFLVIGFGLERVFGESLQQLLSRVVLRPLRMTSTGFSVPSIDRSRLLNGYDRYGQAMPYHVSNAGAAWGLYSSTEDMAKFVRWQLQEQDPAITQSHQGLVGNLREGVAMAWQLASEGDRPMLWHGGGSFDMSAQVVLFPSQHEGYVLLANDACEGTESALRQVALSLHRKLASRFATQ
jgi:CubicO group peptidase (beta-lactamase class C family)